jgi:hypothetical protein
MKSFVIPMRLRATEAGRKVTWLELFFDLVFVAAAAATVMLALAIIGAVSANRRPHRAADWIAPVTLAALTLAAGVFGGFASPVALITLIVGVLLMDLTYLRPSLP